MLKRNEATNFDLLTYFEGKTLASGIFESRSGDVKRRFTVEMMGRADGSTLVLEEQFDFDDGERQQRIWTLTRGNSQSFTGTSVDSVSEAQGGFEQGRAYMRSSLRLMRDPPKNPGRPPGQPEACRATRRTRHWT